MTVTKYNSALNDYGSCLICHEDYKIGDWIADLSCKHLYHEECLLKYMMKHPNLPKACFLCLKPYDLDLKEAEPERLLDNLKVKICSKIPEFSWDYKLTKILSIWINFEKTLTIGETEKEILFCNLELCKTPLYLSQKEHEFLKLMIDDLKFYFSSCIKEPNKTSKLFTTLLYNINDQISDFFNKINREEKVIKDFAFFFNNYLKDKVCHLPIHPITETLSLDTSELAYNLRIAFIIIGFEYSSSRLIDRYLDSFKKELDGQPIAEDLLLRRQKYITSTKKAAQNNLRVVNFFKFAQQTRAQRRVIAASKDPYLIAKIVPESTYNGLICLIFYIGFMSLFLYFMQEPSSRKVKSLPDPLDHLW